MQNKKINRLEDTVRRLLNNPLELNRMRAKAKAVAKPFAAAHTAKLIIDIINENKGG